MTRLFGDVMLEMHTWAHDNPTWIDWQYCPECKKTSPTLPPRRSRRFFSKYHIGPASRVCVACGYLFIKVPIDFRRKREVNQLDWYECVYCGGKRDLCIDHVIPESLGGTDLINNLVTACRSCNSRKGSLWVLLAQHGRYRNNPTYLGPHRFNVPKGVE